MLLLVGSVLAAGLTGWAAQSEFVIVTNEDNGEIAVSSYVLQEDDFLNPRLRLLRSREKLDDVVAAGATQFDKIVLLRRWVRSQWQSSGDFYYPPWDALEILDLARQHGNRGFCAQYAVVFLQACQSLGIHGRYVDLSGHFIVAVWSDDFDKWVVMDPSQDIHYEKDGVPAGGATLCRAYWGKDVRGFAQCDSSGHRNPVALGDLANYRLYSIDLTANQLSVPVQVQVNGVWKALVHANNYRSYPRIGRDAVIIGSNFLAWRVQESEAWSTPRPETRDQDEFRYALNQTVILLANERVRDRIMKVVLMSNNSPTFERFLVRSDGGSDWVPSPAAKIRWQLHAGMNELDARVETRFGWRGNDSSIRVLYKPPLFGFLPALRGNVVRLTWHRPAA